MPSGRVLKISARILGIWCPVCKISAFKVSMFPFIASGRSSEWLIRGILIVALGNVVTAAVSIACKSFWRWALLDIFLLLIPKDRMTFSTLSLVGVLFFNRWAAWLRLAPGKQSTCTLVWLTNGSRDRLESPINMKGLRGCRVQLRYLLPWWGCVWKRTFERCFGGATWVFVEVCGCGGFSWVGFGSVWISSLSFFCFFLGGWSH